MTLMMERLHAAKGIDPVADGFAGTVYSDVYSLRDHGRILFVVYVGVGTTGTSTITVEACDDVTPSNTSAIAFWSREITATDVQGAITRQASTGFTTTAGSSKIVLVEADAKDLASSGYGFIRAKLVEVANDPVLGGIMVLLDGGPGRYQEDVSATVLA